MGMTIHVMRNKLISDLQQAFASAYPFLKIDFYKRSHLRDGVQRQRLNKSLQLDIAGIVKEGELRIDDAMTVGELEKAFRDDFGAMVQVSRRAGTVWLETTMTDGWTLKQQNDHGRELSEPLSKDTDFIYDA
jgi:hypothetical protein